MNFLGRGISWLTGNVDDTDRAEYDEIIGNFDKNEIKLEEQVKQGYSLSSEIINKSNANAQRIEQNEKLPSSKIQQLYSFENDSLTLKEFVHTSETLNYATEYSLTVLSYLSEIETSLVFCINGQLHPSVISLSDLYKELKTIKQYHK